MFAVLLAAVLAGAVEQPLTTASVGGLVTAGDTGQPVARARVVLTAETLPTPRVTLTNAAGQYRIDRLPPGLYSIVFSHSEFLTRGFDAPLDLTERQQMEQVNVALERAAVIRGRILDEDGSPFRGAIVQALRAGFDRGPRTLSVAAAATTDELGHFSLAGLKAGDYLVAAADPAFHGAAPSGVASAPTYYPGVSTAEAAAPVRAAPPSAGPPPIEFRLRIVPPVQVSGRLLTADNRPLRSAAVIMSPQHAVDAASAGEARLQPDGRFSFESVAAGRYVIRARGVTERDGASLFASFRISVEGRDIRDVQLMLTPGGLIEGRVVLQRRHEHAPPPMTSLRVRAPLEDGSPLGDTPGAAVGSDGRFRLIGVIAGTHLLMVDGLTFPWRIAGARLQGRDVAETTFEVERDQQFRNVEIALSDTAAGVRGTVTAPAATSPSDVLVVALPADPFRRRVPLRFVRTARVRPDGGFELSDLVPGDYLLVAALALDETDLMRPEVLDRLAQQGTRVTLAEARVARVALQAESAILRP